MHLAASEALRFLWTERTAQECLKSYSGKPGELD